VEKSCPKRGATLFELLIVIAILAVIASITVSGLGRYQRNARDVKRKSDLKEVKTALELFRKDCGFYPTDKNIDDQPLICGGQQNDCHRTVMGYPIPGYTKDICIDISTPSTANLTTDFLKILVDLGYLKKQLLDPINTCQDCPNFGGAPDATKDRMYIYYTWGYGKNYCLMTMLENQNDPNLLNDDLCDNDTPPPNLQQKLELFFAVHNFSDGYLYAVSSN